MSGNIFQLQRELGCNEAATCLRSEKISIPWRLEEAYDMISRVGHLRFEEHPLFL